jgi:hypothetical protein
MLMEQRLVTFKAIKPNWSVKLVKVVAKRRVRDNRAHTGKLKIVFGNFQSLINKHEAFADRKSIVSMYVDNFPHQQTNFTYESIS